MTLQDIVNGLGNGIGAGFGAVGNGMVGVGQFVDNLLNGSKPKTPAVQAAPPNLAAIVKTASVPTAAPVVPTTTPVATPPSNLADLTKQIQNGFSNWSGGTPPPIATQSANLATAGQGLPDPLLPAIMTLIESRGMQDATPKANANPYNIFYPGTQNSVDYQGNPDTAILGGTTPSGDKKAGFIGSLKGGIYNDYLKSGNLADFFSHYSPPSDVAGGDPNNPTMQDLLDRYASLRSNFVK